MLDLFNRKIDYLRISVTDKCNLRCLYCRPLNPAPLLPRSHILKYEEIEVVIKNALELGINKFRITGGEPLIRKDLLKFINRLKTIKGIEDLSITTNGLRLKEYIKPLYEAGIKRINVSLDTLSEDKFKKITKGENLNNILEAIDMAKAFKFLFVKINVVLIRGINDDEILDFARLTFNKKIEVRFIELMPLGQGKFLGKDKVIPYHEVKLRCQWLGPLKPVEVTYGNGPAKYYQFAGALGRIGFISPLTNPFCQSCNRLRLTADGFLKSCLAYNTGVNLKTALRPKIDGPKIKYFIEEAIKLKPRSHNMLSNASMDNIYSMSGIGG